MIMFFGFETTGKNDFEEAIKEAQKKSSSDDSIAASICYMKIEDRSFIGVMMNYNVYFLKDLTALKNTVRTWLQGHRMAGIAYAASRANWVIIPLSDEMKDEEGEATNEKEKRIRFKL